MNEQWKDIEGFEGKYQVSRNGEILNKRTGKVAKGSPTGYAQVTLCDADIGKTFLVHRLVAKAFIPNPDNLPQVHHIDGNKQNNSAENLEWVSCKAHGAKMTAEQKAKFRETYQKNLEKRKNIAKGNCM